MKEDVFDEGMIPLIPVHKELQHLYEVLPVSHRIVEIELQEQWSDEPVIYGDDE